MKPIRYGANSVGPASFVSRRGLFATFVKLALAKRVVDDACKTNETDQTNSPLCRSDEFFLSTLPNSRREVLSIGDWDINLVRAGTGPSLCFLHGIGNSWRWWQPILTAMSSEFSVTAIDLPGAGESSPLTQVPNRSDYGALLAGVLEAVGPSTIVGHSLGGFIAAQAALQKVDGIKGLFLVAPAGFGPIENRYLRLLALPGVGGLLNRTGRIGLPLLLNSLVHQKSVVELMLCWVDASASARQQFLFQLQIALDNLGRTTSQLLISDAEKLEVPVALLWGKFDSVFSLETAYNAETVLNSASLTIFDNSGHHPQLEETDFFLRSLKDFIEVSALSD